MNFREVLWTSGQLLSFLGEISGNAWTIVLCYRKSVLNIQENFLKLQGSPSIESFAVKIRPKLQNVVKIGVLELFPIMFWESGYKEWTLIIEIEVHRKEELFFIQKVNLFQTSCKNRPGILS